MAYLVDGEGLCLPQRAILRECVLLEEKAHVVGALQEILVCLLRLQACNDCLGEKSRPVGCNSKSAGSM